MLRLVSKTAKSMASPTLWLIPTPIGSDSIMKEIPGWNLQVVSKLRYFLVESIPSAEKFIKNVYKILHKPLPQDIELISLKEYTGKEHLLYRVIRDIAVKKEEDIGLMSDAGYPCIMDPGADIVAWAHELGIRVQPLVGPSSFLLGAASSGFRTDKWIWLGYLSRDKSRFIKDLKQIESFARKGFACIWMETPYRVPEHFRKLKNHLPDEGLLLVASNLMFPDQRILVKEIKRWKKDKWEPEKANTVFGFSFR